MTAPIIELRGIRRTYQTGADMAVDALRGIDLDIFPGDFIAIRGQSGSGKTTLMNLIGCLDRPTDGSYRFAGRDISDFDGDALAALRRESFGFVFQSYNLLSHATAIENVEVPAIYAGVRQDERHRRASEILTRLGLADRLDHRPSQLSGGQQQRVAIARALMNGAHAILADEPTGALDSHSGDELMALLESLAREGHTVVLITHDPRVAARADIEIEMLDGEIVSVTNRREHESPALPIDPTSQTRSNLIAESIESMRTAFRSLSTNVFRTFLTLLGIVIGVSAVVTNLAIGEGAQEQILNQYRGMGANSLTIWPEWRQRGRILFSDPASIEDEIPNVTAVIPELGRDLYVLSGQNAHETRVTATTPNVPAMRDWPLASGVFFEQADSDDLTPVAVLGRTVVDEIFPDGSDPIGEYIVLKNVPFLVIGVMTRKGTSDRGNDRDDVVFVPLMTGAVRLFGSRSIQSMTVIVDDDEFLEATENDVRGLLIERHGREDFRLLNRTELIANRQEANATFALLLASVAGISLLVGGIGIMNIMLVSVTERTREIGIRMATGARQRDILVQFLIEATVVCGLGGALGLVLGVALAGVASQFDVAVAYTAWPMVLSFGCAAAIGLVFGFAPARKAARLDPVVALSSD